MSMLAPVLPVLAKVGMAAGTGISALAQIQAGAAARQQGEMAQQLGERRAQQALAEGRERSSRMTQANRERLSAMRARMAAGGTTVSGSAVDILSESARRLQLRASDAWGVSTADAANERHRGAVGAFEGQQQQSASQMRGFGTLLEGVSSYSRTRSKWEKPKTAYLGE